MSQVFLPDPEPDISAMHLDSRRAHAQINSIHAILFTHFELYEPKRRGRVGWSGHPVVELWRGHDLWLARYALALATELKERGTRRRGLAALSTKRKRVAKWRKVVELLESEELDVTPCDLHGEYEWHAGYRALLLFKGCQDTTIDMWKRHELPDVPAVRNLPADRRKWHYNTFISLWKAVGRPSSKFYEGFGWDESPSMERYYYTADREPWEFKRRRAAGAVRANSFDGMVQYRGALRRQMKEEAE